MHTKLTAKLLIYSTADERGVAYFAFHGSINKNLRTGEPGDFYENTPQKSGREWAYENSRVQLRPGDVLYFWMYVQHDEFGYHLNDQRATYPGE